MRQFGILIIVNLHDLNGLDFVTEHRNYVALPVTLPVALCQ